MKYKVRNEGYGMKTNNIINFYVLANKLKYKIRTGWIEIGIQKERLESVADIYMEF